MVSCKSKVVVKSERLTVQKFVDGVEGGEVLVESRKADMWSFEARPHFRKRTDAKVYPCHFQQP